MKLRLYIKVLFWVCLSHSAFGTSWIRDTAHFMRGGLKNFDAVGTIFPLSRYMAAAMIKNIDQAQLKNGEKKVTRIIEVGAGNGALTEYLVTWMEQQKKLHSNEYVLDLVELDSDFCASLTEKFKNYPWVHVHCADISKFKSAEQYDILISTLPFNSKIFNADMVKQIIQSFEDMTKDKGVIMYVEYAACGKINKTLFLDASRKAEFDAKHALLNRFKAKHDTASRIVFRNVPPTHLYTVKIRK